MEDDADEEREYGEVPGKVAASMGAVEAGSSTTTSYRSGNRRVGSSLSSSPDSDEMQRIGLRCKICAGEGVDEPLFISPCRCTERLVHRSCIEDLMNAGPGGTSCHCCGAAYPARRQTKPMWRWLLEQDTQEAAIPFFGNLAFCAGNIHVLVMAWLYLVYEIPDSLWMPVLRGALLVFTIFWVAVECFCFRRVYIAFAQWKSSNTRLMVLLDQETTV